MAKRTATTELTDRNWDQEEETEDAGTFSKANDDTLKTRQIIKAKRRNLGAAENAPAAFSGFGGFSFKPTQTSTPLLGLGGFKTESKITTAEKNTPAIKSQSPVKRQKAESNGSDTNGSGVSEERTAYLSNLKALNQSVLNWINQHVDKNPYCILSPIFKDYENHIAELNKNKDMEKEISDTNGKTSELKKEETSKAMEESEESKAVLKTGLTFGLGNLKAGSIAPTNPTPFSGFNFKPATSGTSSSAGAFSFAVGSSAPSLPAEASTADEEYVPPKPEAMEHKEEGSLYNKKCKLFYQKDGAWVERGVGYLHLKKNDNKAQLLVRADTALGNILLNIRLSEGVPLSRQGKNNISMMCVANPPIPKLDEDKPVPMLIRVKTSNDADEALDKMKEIRS